MQRLSSALCFALHLPHWRHSLADSAMTKNTDKSHRIIIKQPISKTPPTTTTPLLLLFMNARLPGETTAGHTDYDVDNKEQDARQDHIHLDVPPEHHSGHILGGLSKGDGLKKQTKVHIRITAIAFHRRHPISM